MVIKTAKPKWALEDFVIEKVEKKDEDFDKSE